MSETRLPVWISDKIRRTRDEEGNFSMSAVIVQNEQPTTRSYLSLQVATVGTPLGNGKASILVEPTRLAKYITSIYILTR